MLGPAQIINSTTGLMVLDNDIVDVWLSRTFTMPDGRERCCRTLARIDTSEVFPLKRILQDPI